MWKRSVSMVLILAMVSFFMISAAEAGSTQHHRWEGAAIALGALALGGLIAHSFHPIPSPPPQIAYPPPPRPYHPPPGEYVPGHWKTVREWVPGTQERVWVPGRYDPWRRWVPGHYEEVQTPGHYEERRVWVEGHYRHL